MWTEQKTSSKYNINHLNILALMKSKQIEEISHQAAAIKNTIFDTQIWINNKLGSKGEAEAIKQSKLIPLTLADENGTRHETAMTASNLLKLLNWEADPQVESNESKSRKDILENIHNALSGDAKSIISLQGLAQERLKAIVDRENRREIVRAEVMADNKKERIAEILSEVSQLSYPQLSMEDPRFQSYIAAMAVTEFGQDKDIVLNNLRDTQLYIQEAAKQMLPITPEFIATLNQKLTINTLKNGVIPGQFRAEGEEVLSPNGYYIAGEHVKEEISYLCDWINQELKNCNKDKTKIIEAAARTYSWSVSIQPFKEGNGRTCRMLANYILISYNLPGAIFEKGKANATVYGQVGTKELSAKQSVVLKNMVDGMIIANEMLKAESQNL